MLGRIHEVARDDPGRTAVVSDDEAITYGELLGQVTAWATKLSSHGVGAGTPVVVALRQPADVLGVILGTWTVGAIPVPFDTRRPRREFESVVSEFGASTVTDSAGEGLLVESCPDPVGWDPGPELGLSVSDDDVVAGPMMFLSSGSTGTSKVVGYTANQIMRNVSSLSEVMHWNRDDRCLTAVAPTFAASLVNCALPSLSAGGTVVFAKTTVPHDILATARHHRATLMFALPFTYELMMRSRATARLRESNELRVCMSSSASLDPRTVRQFYERTGHPIRSMYCSSEAGTCTYNASDDLESCADSVGRPLPGVELKIVDEEGRERPPGGEGQIVVDGGLRSLGYVGRGARSYVATAFGPHGVATQDCGWLDASGNLHLKGRMSDTFSCAGSEVDPLEVERVLTTHPAVIDALVYGRHNRELSARVIADVVLRQRIDMRELGAHCADNLATYKVPHQFNVVEEIPRNLLGKKLRPSM